MPKTVAFLNKKGGVGKTSTTFHLGGELARRGLHILLVDADAQASLTQGVLGPEATEALDPSQTVAAVFDESGVAVTGDLVHATAFRNLWVLPGSEAAERWNLAEPWNETDRQFLLRDALEEVGARFDLVLIDCPPHISLWAWSALVAADGVVVPLQAEDYGAGDESDPQDDCPRPAPGQQPAAGSGLPGYHVQQGPGRSRHVRNLPAEVASG